MPLKTASRSKRPQLQPQRPLTEEDVKPPLLLTSHGQAGTVAAPPTPVASTAAAATQSGCHVTYTSLGPCSQDMVDWHFRLSLLGCCDSAGALRQTSSSSASSSNSSSNSSSSFASSAAAAAAVAVAASEFNSASAEDLINLHFRLSLGRDWPWQSLANPPPPPSSSTSPLPNQKATTIRRRRAGRLAVLKKPKLYAKHKLTKQQQQQLLQYQQFLGQRLTPNVAG